MRILICILLIITISSCLQSPFGKTESLALNRNPQFQVNSISAFSSGLNDSKEPGLFLEVNISDSIKEKFFKLQRVDKLRMLKNDSTDWTTNLLLYEEYKEDAFLYISTIKNRADWLPIKDQEFKKWESILR